MGSKTVRRDLVTKQQQKHSIGASPSDIGHAQACPEIVLGCPALRDGPQGNNMKVTNGGASTPRYSLFPWWLGPPIGRHRPMAQG